MVLDRKASIGERIAFYRKQRGLTQQGLAMRLNRSPSWLRKIEQGSRPLTDVNVIAQVAQNLGVKVADLLGKPIFPEPVGDRHEPGPVVPQLRRVLLHYDTIHGFAEDFGDDPPRPVEELERDYDHAQWLHERSRHNFSDVAWRLPGLLTEARRAIHLAGSDAERRAARRVLANLYRLASITLWQYGDDDLGWVAADRAIAVAEQVEEPLLVAAGARDLQQLLLAQGHYGDVMELADAAGSRIAPGRDATREQLTVWGSIQLIAAFAAARGKDRAEHQRLLAVSTRAAERLGEDRKDFGLDFGPTNLAIQHAGMLVEWQDPTAAVRFGETVAADRLPAVDRRCFHRVHLARAQFMRRKDPEAVALLVEAEDIAPEIVRWEPMTREMTHVMLRRARRADPALRGLAQRVGVLA